MLERKLLGVVTQDIESILSAILENLSLSIEQGKLPEASINNFK